MNPVLTSVPPLARPALSPTQLLAILVCFLITMLDGMDVMVISYAAPAIAEEWSRTGVPMAPAQLGVVFSTGLLGMAIGAMFLAAQADRVGRRRIILLSGVLMGSCVVATVYVTSMPMLALARFVSGIGIGSMLASTATLTAEYAPAKTKSFWVSFVMAGYPIGAVLSGMVAASIIPAYGWRSLFIIAGVTTLLTLPIVYLFLAESLDFLRKRRPVGRWRRRILFSERWADRY